LASFFEDSILGKTSFHACTTWDSGQAAAIEFEPSTDKEMGISGVAPTGWTESGPGVFGRGSSGLDVATLVVQAAPRTC